ncbi:IclR family transcriptional regulator [Pseudomonas sp. Leaf58]|uniref:IclR family transcriptional regulator n=1 Tax=Pseudomonas sp. Leaf58 TaxID=1736226 RepID=UPI0006FD6EC6|nr:IclR family transcriptional regulator [Pseudomonas sp. Leaf58]AYG44631.1 IclR family transcriptional regulator [Pseudomonas sp. Leaf58]KQN61304.1 IclR family transcriptional regulator [Pseudomonas sp. Leaf58]
MSNALERGLHAIELLAGKSTGLALQQVAEALDIPPSATHRMLNCLVEQGFVRQEHQHGHYVLALKVVSLALKHLSQSDMVDLARPILERLAQASGELVRLSIVDGDSLIWISKAQGSRSGLRYDPDAGAEAKLCCTASGLAWLSCLSNERALELVYRQGLAKPGEYGPNAATTIEQLLDNLKIAREQGYASVDESFEVGAASMAAAIRDSQQQVVGVISIAGPSVRLSAERMQTLKAALLEAAHEITAINLDSLPKLSMMTSRISEPTD